MSDIVERLNRAGDLAIPGEPCCIYYDAAKEIERLKSELARALDKNVQLQSEVEAGDKDEKELFNCRKACENLDADNDRLRKQLAEVSAENRRLKDNRQQWLERDRDNQIVIQTLKDVISDLR